MYIVYLGSTVREQGSEMGERKESNQWCCVKQVITVGNQNSIKLGNSGRRCRTCFIVISAPVPTPSDRKLEYWFSNSDQSLAEDCLLGHYRGHHEVPPRFSFKEGLVAQLLGLLSIDIFPLSTHSVIASAAESCLANVTPSMVAHVQWLIEVKQ